MTHDKYPTLHALGLGPALDEVERVCAIGASGKYAGQKLDPRPRVHVEHAQEHIMRAWDSSGLGGRDVETDERELAHAAARLLMALATSGGWTVTIPHRAVTLYAPHAYALMWLGKDIENRAHNFPRFVGDVWVHAGWGPAKHADFLRELRDVEFAALLAAEPGQIANIPEREDLVQRCLDLRGHILGRITFARHGSREEQPESPWFTPGRRPIFVANPRPLKTPVPARGAQGLWAVWEYELVHQLKEAL